MTKAAEEVLRRLHMAVFKGYGRAVKTEVKRNLRLFCGFAPEGEEAAGQRANCFTVLDGTHAETLKEMALLLDVPKKGSKKELVQRLCDFLAAPESSGTAFTMKRKPVAKGKKGKKRKKAAGGKKRPPSAFLLFSMKMRPKVKEMNPDASFGDIGRLLGEMWSGLSDEKKKKYKDKAEELKGGGGDEEEEDEEEEEEGGDDEEGEEEKGSDSEDEPLVKKPKVDRKPELEAATRSFLTGADLTELSVRKVRQHLALTFGEELVTEEKAFIKGVVSDFVANAPPAAAAPAVAAPAAAAPAPAPASAIAPAAEEAAAAVTAE